MCILYPGSEFFHPESRVKKIPDPVSNIKKIPDSRSGFASKNLSIFKKPKKLFLSYRKYDPGRLSWIRILIFPIPDPGVKKASDLGTGSAILVGTGSYFQ
jgi:hypothetical protein